MYIDAVQILTSTVIECYRSNMKESAFKFATILMKSDYRHQVISNLVIVYMHTIYYNSVYTRLTKNIEKKLRVLLESLRELVPKQMTI